MTPVSASPFREVVTSERELRALIGAPSELALRKEIARLDAHCRAFIAHAPFLLPGETPRKEMQALAPWTDLWFAYAAGAFLSGYQEAVSGSRLLLQPQEDADLLLRAFLCEKAMRALDAESSARPEWAPVPARLLRLLLPAVPK